MNHLLMSSFILGVNFILVLFAILLWYIIWVKEYGCSIPNEKINDILTYFNSKNFDMVFNNLGNKIIEFNKDFTLSSIGFEAYAYLLFQRQIIGILFFLTIVSTLISSITTYLTIDNNKISIFDFLSKMLFENKELNTPTSTFHLICMLIFFLAMIRFLLGLKRELKELYFSRFDKLSRKKDSEWLRCRTLHISGISPTERNVNLLKAKLNFFLSNQGNLNKEVIEHSNNLSYTDGPGQVVEVSFIPDYKNLTQLEIEKEEINDLKKLLPSNKSFLYRWCFLSKTFRSEESTIKRLVEIEEKIDEEVQKVVYSSGHAFVTFSSLKSAYSCLQAFKEDTFKKLKIKFKEIQENNKDLEIGGRRKSTSTFRAFHDEDLLEGNFNIEKMDIMVDQMIEPLDIIWTNVGGDRGVNLWRIIFATILLFLVLIFLTTPTVMYSALKHIIIKENNEQVHDYRNATSLIAPLVIITLNQLIVMIIDTIGQFENHYTHSRMQYSIFKNTFFYFILNMLIIPGITLTTATSLYGVLFNGKTFSFEYINSTLSKIYIADNGFFFTTMIINMGAFSFLFYLLRIDEIVTNSFSSFITFYKRHFVNNGKQWHRRETDVFAYGFFYAQMLTVLSISVVFCSTVPFVVFAGLLFFISRHVTDYLSLLVVHREEIDSNGNLVSILI